MTDLPYQVEYAKTGRAGCKVCKQKIDQGALRIAVMVQSGFFDGKQPHWHHEECFFKKQHPSSVTDIAYFNKLKADDQKRIKDAMVSSLVVMPEVKGKGKAKKRAADEGSSSALKDFQIEYAKSNRATCRHCDIKICKDEVRIAKTVYDTESGVVYGGQTLWYHVKCFAEKRNELLYFAGGESLPGFEKIKKEDQEVVKSQLKPLKADEVPVKIIKDAPKNAAELKEDKEKAKLMVKQSDLFHKYRLELDGLKKTLLNKILESNSQEECNAKDACLDRVADMMVFGALERCPECKKGQLVLDTFGYKCHGNLSNWTKCTYITDNPKRVPMIVPDVGKDDKIFKNYKPQIDVRLFETAKTPPAFAIVKEEPAVQKDKPTPPLKNLQFFLYGKLKNKEETKKRVLKLGGKFVSQPNERIAAAISTKEDVEQKHLTIKMKQIKRMAIKVVEESFLDHIDNDGTVAKALEIIKEKNIADWGSDISSDNIPHDDIDGKSIAESGSKDEDSENSSTVKFKVKGGAAVDPDSKLVDVAHVFENDDGKYTVVLSQTDVSSQKNSFYKLQMLESDDRTKYWLFRAWGRIGTTSGGNKVEECKDLPDAASKFQQIFKDKTKNSWLKRHEFVKVPGKYYPLDLDYAVSDAPKCALTVENDIDLPEPVQRLVIKLFNVQVMEETLLEFKLDLKKMPLGKLSKEQIKSGYKVLSELIKCIDDGGNQGRIIDGTNRFFTLIPHDFGMKNAPLLDNMEIVKSKTDMLDNLLEIEVAYSLLKTENYVPSPIYSNYLKLKANIMPVSSDTPDYEMIQLYVHNTFSPTWYTIEIEQVFTVAREGEDERFKPFKNLHNRRLLWHGSRHTNFASIISKGLCLPPPEAHVWSYMYGKGIYFADNVTKSCNYCHCDRINTRGLLLLCEVALGDMKRCTRHENVVLPPGMHSAWGVGRWQPDPAQYKVLEDGLIVPLGTSVKANDPDAYVDLNEFVVYDPAQVHMKYLVQMKFKYSDHDLYH